MGTAGKNTGAEALGNAPLAAWVKEYGAEAGKKPAELQIEDSYNTKGEVT